MKTRKSVYSLAKIVLLTAFCLALSPITANSQVCMDVDGNGVFNVLDFTYLYSYLHRGGPPPPDPWSANVDGFEKITLADWCYLEGRYGAGYPASACSVIYPPIQPIPDSTLLLSHTQWLDSGVADAVITMELSNNKVLEGLSLVFDLYIGDEQAAVDSFRICTPSRNESCGSIRIDSVQDSVVIIPIIYGHNSYFPLYRFYLYATVNPSPQRRPVSIEFTHASPAQASSPDSSLITMIIEQPDFSPFMFKIWEPVIICCFQDRGDLNGDGDAGNVLDLTHLVDYIFRGSGDAGNCPEETDLNEDGVSSNILDLTTLVDYIFRGGAALPSCYF